MTPHELECDTLLRLLQTPQIFEDVRADSESEFALQKRLREKYDPEIVRLTLTLLEVRQRAAGKFTRAAGMWMNRIGMEQATAEPVAHHKAQRFAAHGVDRVLDLCSGVGMDAIALAMAGCQVQAVDISPLALKWVELNANVYEVADRVTTMRQQAQETQVRGAWVHLDPDRRAGKGRVLRVEDYEPNYDEMLRLVSEARGGAIKLSPASNFGGKFDGCELELISLDGECKEATIWFGELQSEYQHRATMLPAGYSLAGDPWLARGAVTPLGQFIYDPDPAVVRAGLVDVLAVNAGYSRLDAAEEYLTSHELISSPAATPFEVLAEFNNNEKEIRKFFRQSDYGDIEIKCRHIPTDANRLRKKLTLNGQNRATLFIARIAGKSRAIIARRLSTVPS